jgi:mRNA-degrading endonuclease HigB of HigAB toxin-antitoxin module
MGELVRYDNKTLREGLTKKQARLKNGWGNWKLDIESLELVFQFENIEYPIPLDRCNNSSQILDWIYQIYSKSWAEPQDVYALISAFNDIVRVQDQICCFGIDVALKNKFKMVTHIQEVITPFLAINFKEG